MAVESEEDKRRKVKTRDGRVGMVMYDLTRRYCSVQVTRAGQYVVFPLDDLEDITEEEFKRTFK